MPGQRGRDFVLKIGDGGAPEVFTALGAARLVSLTINNQPADITAMKDSGCQTLAADAGVQMLEITLDGLFKDAAAEETLRLSAFNRTIKNYQLVFPNGDLLAAAFVIAAYHRAGAFDGLETFTVTLIRSGAGVVI